MLLAVDVGNTDTTLGLLEHDTVVHTWRVGTSDRRTVDEHALLFASLLQLNGLSFDRNVSGVAIASVVPDVTHALREMVPRYFHYEAFVVEPGIRTGMKILLDNPKEAGADRICNAVAGAALYGGPAVVVDLGTATTFEAITEAGEYVGGAIAPGLRISAEALFTHAAQLKRVELVEPLAPIGRSTVEALKSGLVLGYASMIEGMVEVFRKELGGAAKTIVTGGLAEVLLPHMSGIDEHDPWLVLRGLRLLFDRNAD